MGSKLKRKDTEEISLDAVNKQVIEMKKKISLLEGQRKAHYEMWDNEKKQNGEKIKILKENIRKLYAELGRSTTAPKNIKICDKITAAMFLNKNNDEALESLDFKVIEARKKLDLLQHEINQKQQQIMEFSVAQTAQTAKLGSGISRQIIPNTNTVSSLENQIHQIEINNMEAEHLKKKYKTIRNQLLEESVGFESTLKKLEEKINHQENEISRLQKAYEEAILLRNMTYETLAEQEKNLIKVQEARENELEQLRSKVENYKNELERLERHMYPIKSTTRRDSQSGIHDGETEVGQQSEYLEKIFDTLKEATGVIENEDVLKRFLSQRDTRVVLEKMKAYSENEKQQLIQKKEEITTELETHKFADMKDQERSEEELETLQNEIQKENENYAQVNEEYDKLQQQIKTIMERIHHFCLQMKDFDVANVPEKCPSIEKCEWLLKLFRTKVESAMRHNKGKSEKKKEKVKSADLWVHLPYYLDSKVSDIDDEEEVPTRNSLKREAQIIYETRNRKKVYRVGLGK